VMPKSVILNTQGTTSYLILYQANERAITMFYFADEGIEV
jgi:hypothetical protein